MVAIPPEETILTTEEIVAHAERFIPKLREIERLHADGFRPGLPPVSGLQAQILDFLQRFSGKMSPFAVAAEVQGGADGYRANILVSVIEGFIDHARAGLLSGAPPETKGRIDAVSDFLMQANAILNEKQTHPAAAVVLIGASLEEFLRTWTEMEGLDLGNRKPGLASFSHALMKAGLIGKQDLKDIESWGGLRNHAAHGAWNEVDDVHRIRLMLEGVNLFMRRHAIA